MAHTHAALITSRLEHDYLKSCHRTERTQSQLYFLLPGLCWTFLFNHYATRRLILAQAAGDEGGVPLDCHVHVTYAWETESCRSTPLPTVPGPRKRACFSTVLTNASQTIATLWVKRAWAEYRCLGVNEPFNTTWTLKTLTANCQLLIVM